MPNRRLNLDKKGELFIRNWNLPIDRRAPLWIISALYFSIFIAGEVRAQGTDGELLYGRGGIARLRRKAQQTQKPPYGPSPGGAIKKLLQKADSLLKKPYTYRYKSFYYSMSSKMPPRHRGDNFPYWTAMFQERSDSITTRINLWTFAYLVTSSKRYFQAALNIVLDLSAWSSWSDPDYKCYPGPACLDTGHAAMSVGYFYDAVRSKLTSSQRKTIRGALISRGLIPLEKAAKFAMTRPAHNLDAIVAMGLGVGAASLYGEDPRAAQWLNTAIALTKKYLSKQGPEGAPLEYHGYGAYAMDYLARLLAVADYRGITIKSSFVDNLSRFYLSSLAPDGSGVGTFGDSWPRCAGPIHFYLVSRRDSIAQAYLVDSGLIEYLDFLTIVWADGYLRPQRLPPKPYTFPTIGFGTLRSRSDEKATFVVFKSGPPKENVGHNQLDHLSFQIWARGSWLMGDPGYSKTSQPPQFYRFTEEAFGHSSILIDRRGPRLKYGAKLNRTAGGKGYGLICGESSQSYPKGSARQIERCLTLHPEGFVVVSDTVKADGPRSVEWLFQPHSSGFAHISGPNQAQLVNPPGRLWLIPAERADSLRLIDFSGQENWPKTLLISNSLSALGAKPVPLKNSGFESGLQYWTPRATTRPNHATDTSAYRGKKSARISFQSPSAGYFYSQRLPIKPGERLWASAMIKTDGVRGAGARLRILFWSKGRYLSDLPGRRVTGSWKWHRRVVSGNAPAGSDQFSVALELNGKGTAWFDDISVYKFSTSAKKPLDVRKNFLLLPAPSPPLVNGDFSAGLATWRVRSQTRTGHSADNGVFRSPPSSARIQFSSKLNSGYFYSTWIKVKPGDKIEATAWIKTSSTAGSGARLRFLFYSGKKYISSYPSTYQRGYTPWQKHSLNTAVPGGIDHLRISLEFTGRGSAWFDDVTYRNLSSPPDPQLMTPPKIKKSYSSGFSFEYAGKEYIFIRALSGPATLKLGNKTLKLDSGVAIFTPALKAPTILLHGQKLESSDGFLLALNKRGSVKVELNSGDLNIEISDLQKGNPPTSFRLDLPFGKGKIRGARVNGSGVPVRPNGSGGVRVCWGTFSQGPCSTQLGEPPTEGEKGELPADRERVSGPDGSTDPPSGEVLTPDGPTPEPLDEPDGGELSDWPDISKEFPPGERLEKFGDTGQTTDKRENSSSEGRPSEYKKKDDSNVERTEGGDEPSLSDSPSRSEETASPPNRGCSCGIGGEGNSPWDKVILLLGILLAIHWRRE